VAAGIVGADWRKKWLQACNAKTGGKREGKEPKKTCPRRQKKMRGRKTGKNPGRLDKKGTLVFNTFVARFFTDAGAGAPGMEEGRRWRFSDGSFRQ
jgi:hypothetical protein